VSISKTIEHLKPRRSVTNGIEMLTDILLNQKANSRQIPATGPETTPATASCLIISNLLLKNHSIIRRYITKDMGKQINEITRRIKSVIKFHSRRGLEDPEVAPLFLQPQR
jgi:hypothetical protein